MGRMNKQNEHKKREESYKENGQNNLRQGAEYKKKKRNVVSSDLQLESNHQYKEKDQAYTWN